MATKTASPPPENKTTSPPATKQGSTQGKPAHTKGKPAPNQGKGASKQGKPDQAPPGKNGTQEPKRKKPNPCPYACSQVPTNVPKPEAAQTVLHPRKDVFLLKVCKVNAAGERRTKMELELVTPKGHDHRPPHRTDTRETQFTRPSTPCCAHCCSPCRSCPRRKGRKKRKGSAGKRNKKK